MNRKVLFTASTYSHIRNFHLPYFREFVRRGWEVHAACGDAPDHIPNAEKSISLPFRKKILTASNFLAARVLHRMIREENYSLVCTHTTLASFFTRLSLTGVINRPAVVAVVHGYLFDYYTNWAVRRVLLLAEQVMAGRTDKLLVMNLFDSRIAREYRLAEEIVSIPGMGVDYSRFTRTPAADEPAGESLLKKKLGIPDNVVVLSCVGEFSRRKNQETLIRAMKYLPDYTVLCLAGDGMLLGRCQAMAGRMGLGSRVLFPGCLHKIGDLYRLADIHLSASRSEGLPFNIMEAMYMGLPVVATNVKGHSDLIQHGETGFLFPRGDSRSCAAYIMRLIQSNSLRREMARQAHKTALLYRLETAMPQVMDAYLSALPGGAEYRTAESVERL